MNSGKDTEMISRCQFWAISIYTGFMTVMMLAIVWFVLRPFPDRTQSNDSSSYELTAVTLLEIGKFAIDSEHPNIPQTMRTPMYPLFIAGIYKLFGLSRPLVTIVQFSLYLMALCLVFWTARRVVSIRTSVFAIILMATSILGISYSTLILAEILFTFFITLFLFLGVHILTSDRNSVGMFAALGFALALATLTRPITYYLIVPLVLLIVIWVQKMGWKIKRIAWAITWLLIPYILLVGGWQRHNWQETGSPELTQISGLNMLFFRAAKVISIRDNISIHDARSQIGGELSELRQQAIMHPERQLGSKWMSEGIEILVANSRESMLMLGSGIANLLIGPGDGVLARVLGFSQGKNGPLGDLLRMTPVEFYNTWIRTNTVEFVLFLWALVHLIALYAGTVFGAVWRPRSNIVGFVFLIMVVSYLVIMSAGPEAYYRFRLPLMPALSIFSALGWSQLLQKLTVKLAHV